MPSLRGLQILHAAGPAALTPEQKRFNNLLRQIENARALLAEWQRQVPLCREAHQRRIVPLLQELEQAERRWLGALDALSEQPKWSKAERQTMAEVICELAGRILDAREEPDPALKALYDRHSEFSFDEEQAENAAILKEFAQLATGIDLGSDEGLNSEQDVLQRMQEKMATAQAEGGEAPVPPWARKKRRQPTAAQKRKLEEAEAATLSLREVFRKLASALHPDRETDPRQREAKTALMQRVNQAYAANDLLSLLSLQLEIEQVDPGHIAGASATRLKHYNKLLAEQLSELKQETQHMQWAFEAEFGISVPWGQPPEKLGLAIDRGAAAIRSELASLERSIRMLRDKPSTKRWLKQMKRALAEADLDDFDDELPF